MSHNYIRFYNVQPRKQIERSTRPHSLRTPDAATEMRDYNCNFYHIDDMAK